LPVPPHTPAWGHRALRLAGSLILGGNSVGSDDPLDDLRSRRARRRFVGHIPADRNDDRARPLSQQLTTLLPGGGRGLHKGGQPRAAGNRPRAGVKRLSGGRNDLLFELLERLPCTLQEPGRDEDGRQP
jgi:hypothetical protein